MPSTSVRAAAAIALASLLVAGGAAAQRRYGEARYTARGGIGVGLSDVGFAVSVEAEVNDWRLHPVGLGFRIAAQGHAAFEEEERTVALVEPEVLLRFGSRRTYLALTLGMGAAWVREVSLQPCDAADVDCTDTGRIRHDGFHPTLALAAGPVHHIYGSLALVPTARLELMDLDRWSFVLVLGLGGTEFWS